MGLFSKKNTSSNQGDQPSQFRVRDAQRIGKVVHEVESARRGRNPSSLPRASGGGGGGGGVRRATFSGAWPINTEKTVTFSENTAQTASVSNFLFNINYSSGSRDALVTDEYLVSVRCQ